MECVEAGSMTNSVYLERYAWQEPLQIGKKDLIIVIPAFKEKELNKALDSINSCDPPKGNVQIVVVINEPENADSKIKTINQNSLEALENYQSNYPLLFSYTKLPAKKAGVGLARKIGMDEAVRIFEKNQDDGVIICYDADCTCDPNYLIKIEDAFSDPKVNAGIVFYEHQLDGPNNFEIINYELYLRYYIDALRFCGFPYAHQTLGSCIAVRSSTYQKAGGMNTRKAGEDFYFLNKVIPLGGFKEINTTTIYPSDRISNRVPFGTGKAVNALKELDRPYSVYHPMIFEDLKQFFSLLEHFWLDDEFSIPTSIGRFLDVKIQEEVKTLKDQTANKESFYKRFFHWFNAFKILKYVHFARDQFYPNVELNQALLWLEENYTGKLPEQNSDKLEALRAIDRKEFTPNQKDFLPQ
jgi:hypothetical protein